MQPMDVFSVRELRAHSARLMRNAEEGKMAVLTKRGKPTALSIPFSERALELGVTRDLAVQLFENGSITLVKAAKLASISPSEFMQLLAQFDIPAVTLPPEDMDREMPI
jgi:prevent-host-death family protein